VQVLRYSWQSKALDKVPYKLSKAVVKLANITFLSLAFSWIRLNLGFLLREKLAAVLIIPTSWGSQLDGDLHQHTMLHQKHGPNNKINLSFNHLGQPRGMKTPKLSNFIGYLVKGRDVSLAATNWRKVPQEEKDKLWLTVKVICMPFF
jgi:hypothetical protein